MIIFFKLLLLCVIGFVHPLNLSSSGKHVFIFGLGYVGSALCNNLLAKGWKISGTIPNSSDLSIINNKNIHTYSFNHFSTKEHIQEIIEELQNCSHILSTISPINTSDIVLDCFSDAFIQLKRNNSLRWVGYLSTTGVYENRNGDWIHEDSEIRPMKEKNINRIKIENQWRALFRLYQLPIHVFRLAGIYGPKRNILEVIQSQPKQKILTIEQTQDIISRIHIDDIVQFISLSMKYPSSFDLVNLADNYPCSKSEVLEYAKTLLSDWISKEPQKDISSSTSIRNRGGSKQIDNSKMRKFLHSYQKDLLYPNYQRGLNMIKKTLFGNTSTYLTIKEI